MPPDDPKQPRELNPYEHVVSILASTLAAFDDDQLIPAYGFGDVSRPHNIIGASRTSHLYVNYAYINDSHKKQDGPWPELTLSLSLLLCAFVCVAAVEHQVQQGLLVL